jgi:hypothetical protein
MNYGVRKITLVGFRAGRDEECSTAETSSGSMSQQIRRQSESNNGGISLGSCPATPHSRSGSDLRYHRTRRLRAMGIRDKPTAPTSPWQNSFAERLIGSIRRECVDHFVVLGEAHLRRILRAYARYYNDIRTHRSLDKDAPVSRPVHRTGIISSHAILGGLHHHYVRV